MRHPRLWHRLYAFAGAYYWKPCPLCQKYYGGHEEIKGYLEKGSQYWGSQHGIMVCPECRSYAEHLNRSSRT